MYALVDRACHGDEEAREQVLASPAVPEALKDSIRSADQRSAAEKEQALVMVKAGLHQQATELASQITRGIRVAFSNDITGMFSTAVWIAMIGLLISCFIPVLTLRSQNVRATPDEEEAVSA